MYFVYAEKEPEYNSDNYEYAFDEFEDKERGAAMRAAAQLKIYGYDNVRIIIGVELELDEGVLDREKEKAEKKEKERENKEKEKRFAQAKSDYDWAKKRMEELGKQIEKDVTIF